MPHYDYVCTVCGTLAEVMHGVHEAGPTACAACGGPMRKALSAPAIVFKGSGWAKKDARPKQSGSSSASDKSETSTTGTPEAARPAPSSGGGSDD